MLPRRALLLALVMAMPFLAGCNFNQWAKQEGTVNVYIMPQPAASSSLNDFQVLKVGVLGVSIHQAQVINPHEFAYSGDPKVVDLVANGHEGKAIKVASVSLPIRAIDSITVRIEGEEARAAAGNDITFCYPGKPNVKHPCVSTPENGGYTIESHNIAIPRGGTVDVYFPLAVKYDAPEYFIQADPALMKEERS